ncbi:MAG: multicopper oxidase domain-containing protein [Desulfuromonadales bacterium]|nr:multicopper oxidase domain-containing protein [Desulfuromonadales bacterium]
MTIPRDLGVPFDPTDPIQLAEFEGFGTDVPTSANLITAIQSPPLIPNAASVRAARMLRPGAISPLLDPNGPFPTPDAITPTPATKTFSRSGRRRVPITLPNVGQVDTWSFKDDFGAGADTWPAPTIRLKEGDLVHSIMSNSHGAHTIHHHGIEPTAMNDGVGHLTFEVGNVPGNDVGGASYVYQWHAAEAGTYFYHCHRNTVLHFELGMYGMLIIDPAVPGAPFADGAAGAIFLGDDIANYQSEAIWVADDIDSRWRALDKSAGIALPDVDANGQPIFVPWGPFPANPRLNDFRPDGFVVSGVAANPADNNVIAGMGKTVIGGQKLLVRALNASYCTSVWKFPSTLSGTVTAVDARTLGRSNNGFGSYSEPYSLASINHQFTLTTAQRWDILIDTAGSSFGTHMVEIEFRHWITNNILRTVRLPIVVASA